MKKVIVIAMVMTVLLVLTVSAAFALTDDQKAELKELYQQEHQLRLQIMEKQVEAGLIDTEDAQALRERMEQRFEQRQEKMDKGDYSCGKRSRNFSSEGPREGCRRGCLGNTE